MSTTLKQYIGQERRTGTYVSVKYTAETSKALHDWAKNHLHLKDLVGPHQYHTTLLYSRKAVDALKLMGDKSPNWIIKPQGYDLLGDHGEALVVLLECPEMIALHKTFIKAGATHDYKHYIPHLTLSYKMTSDAREQIKSFPVANVDLKIAEIKVEPLDLNWDDN